MGNLGCYCVENDWQFSVLFEPGFTAVLSNGTCICNFNNAMIGKLLNG